MSNITSTSLALLYNIKSIVMHVKFDAWKMINSEKWNTIWNKNKFSGLKILIQLNIWELMALYPPLFTPTTTISSKSFNFIPWHFHWFCPISPTCCGNTRCITCTFFCETCLNIFLQVFPLARFSFGPICQSRALVGCFFLLWNFDTCFDFWPVFFDMHLVDNGCWLINKIK